MDKEEAAWMPHNERCGKPDSIGDIRRKKTPACSSFRAGRSFEKSGYLGIERAKGYNV